MVAAHNPDAARQAGRVFMIEVYKIEVYKIEVFKILVFKIDQELIPESAESCHPPT